MPKTRSEALAEYRAIKSAIRALDAAQIRNTAQKATRAACVTRLADLRGMIAA